MYIGGKAVRTGNKMPMYPPHEISHKLGYFHEGEEKHVKLDRCGFKSKGKLRAMPWEDWANIFLKAADLIATKHRP